MILSDHHSKGRIEENTMHHILKWKCPGVMQIITIIGLFLTVYSQYLYLSNIKYYNNNNNIRTITITIIIIIIIII